jgi:serine/threonine protein kinase
MAPRLPERYEAHVRLGRDGDIEEWLAGDTSLDRPVLVRVLDPAATPERRQRFIAAVRAAAQAHHVHLADVYAVGSPDDPYSVLEWHGGVTLADRLAAGEAFPADEFLANAAGLADALGALHAGGGIHGRIDASAIGFAASHPAKLGAFGRDAPHATAAEDTRALATALRASVTGTDDPGVAPSQVAGGLPATVDLALGDAERGAIDARRLSALLHAIPFQAPRLGAGAWSWSWLVLSAGLIVAALLIAIAGRAIDVDPDSPFLYPAAPPPAPASTSPPTTVEPPPDDSGDRIPAQARVYDPEGDGTERDADVGRMLDGNPATSWSTERYFSPLSSVKGGVGVIFTLAERPAMVELVASPGTRYELAWAETVPDRVDGWETTGSGTILDGANRVQLPERDGGIWLLWLTDLPESGEGEFTAQVSEVRFLP